MVADRRPNTEDGGLRSEVGGKSMGEVISSFKDLRVYKLAFEVQPTDDNVLDIKLPLK